MKHKYKLGDFVEYYSAFRGSSDKIIEYTDQRKGFINGIEDRMLEDGSIAIRYSIGLYIGSCSGHVVSEEAIIGKLKAPKNQSRLEYTKYKIMQNEVQIKYLNNENKSLRKEIVKLEKEELE